MAALALSTPFQVCLVSYLIAIFMRFETQHAHGGHETTSHLEPKNLCLSVGLETWYTSHPSGCDHIGGLDLKKMQPERPPGRFIHRTALVVATAAQVG